jgi:hypothetical protein
LKLNDQLRGGLIESSDIADFILVDQSDINTPIHSLRLVGKQQALSIDWLRHSIASGEIKPIAAYKIDIKAIQASHREPLSTSQLNLGPSPTLGSGGQPPFTTTSAPTSMTGQSADRLASSNLPVERHHQPSTANVMKASSARSTKSLHGSVAPSSKGAAGTGVAPTFDLLIPVISSDQVATPSLGASSSDPHVIRKRGRPAGMVTSDEVAQERKNKELVDELAKWCQNGNPGSLSSILESMSRNLVSIVFLACEKVSLLTTLAAVRSESLFP